MLTQASRHRFLTQDDTLLRGANEMKTSITRFVDILQRGAMEPWWIDAENRIYLPVTDEALRRR